MFVGFLPPAAPSAARALARARRAAPTQVLFEAPHRIEALAAALAAACPDANGDAVPRADQAVRDDRDAAGARAAGWLGGRCEPRARRVRASCCMRWPQADADATGAEHDAALAYAAAALPLKQAVALAAELSGAPRNPLYAARCADSGVEASRPAARAPSGRRRGRASGSGAGAATAGRDLTVVLLGLDVRARLLLSRRSIWRRSRGVTTPSALAWRSAARMLRLLALEAARLAAVQLAAGDAGLDPGLLVRLALVDARRAGHALGECAERGDRRA